MFLSFIEAPRWAIMGLAVKIAQSVSNLQDQSEATYPYSISQPFPLLSTFFRSAYVRVQGVFISRF